MSEGNTGQEQRAPSATAITRRARKGPPRAGRSVGERAAPQQQERPEEERPLEEPEPPLPRMPRMPLGIVVARIAIVSSLGFSAAVGIFFLIGGLWQIGLAALAVASGFILLMSAVERLAGSRRLPE